MKIFVCSLIIFGLLCAFISIYNVIFQERADMILDAIKNLPQESDRILTGEIIDLWFKYEDYFNLTVNHNVTDQVEVTMFNLLYAAEQLCSTASNSDSFTDGYEKFRIRHP